MGGDITPFGGLAKQSQPFVCILRSPQAVQKSETERATSRNVPLAYCPLEPEHRRFLVDLNAKPAKVHHAEVQLRRRKPCLCCFPEPRYGGRVVQLDAQSPGIVASDNSLAAHIPMSAASRAKRNDPA